MVKPSFISCYKTSVKSSELALSRILYNGILDPWHCTLSEVLDLTPPFADDLACSGF